MAKCTSCPNTIIKTKESNTSGLDSHLSRKHPDIYKKFLAKRADVLKQRDERKALRESRKRRVGVLDLNSSKQTKLGSRTGVLSMTSPSPDPQVQKLWDDALVDYLAETHVSFRQVSGTPFRKLVNVSNKNSRSKIVVKSRRQLTKHVKKRTEELLSELSGIIRACKTDMKSCSFTTDLWTSRAGDAFLSLTVHFIDK